MGKREGCGEVIGEERRLWRSDWKRDGAVESRLGKKGDCGKVIGEELGVSVTR